MAINYGLNKLRFPSPVPVGSKVGAGATLASLEKVAGGHQGILEVTWEVGGRFEAGLCSGGRLSVLQLASGPSLEERPAGFKKELWNR